MAAIVLARPFSAYTARLAHVTRTDHPLRETSTCVAETRQAGAGQAALFVALDEETTVQHGYYRYFWRLGYGQNAGGRPLW